MASQQSLPSRREFLGRLSALCAAGLAAPAVQAAAPEPGRNAEAFSFLAVNDLHHGTPECTPFVEALAAHMREQGPVDFCLVLGDLTDGGQPASFVAVREAFAGLGVPVYPVPGNHDCDLEGDTRLYAEHFPGRTNYHFTHRGWQFVGLDSTAGRAWHDTRISDAALAFLDETVPLLDPRAPTVVFTHFPLGSIGWMTPLNAADALNRFSGLDLRAALCGHFHGCTAREHLSAALVTTACCSRLRHNHDGTLPEGWLVCTAHADGRLERRFVEFEPARLAEAPAPIPLGPAAPRPDAP